MAGAGEYVGAQELVKVGTTVAGDVLGLSVTEAWVGRGDWEGVTVTPAVLVAESYSLESSLDDSVEGGTLVVGAVVALYSSLSSTVGVVVAL